MIDFKVTPDDGEPFEVKATTRDILTWEKATKGASLKRLLEELRLSDLYAVAYYASKRLRKFEGNRQDFELGVDIAFDLEGDDEAADPTQPGA